MKSRVYYLVALVLLVVCGISAGKEAFAAYANTFGSDSAVLIYANSGRNGGSHHDDDGHYYSRHKYYKHYRHYPHDYYYYKKIYFYPKRSYYYYYDVFPEKIYYFEPERQIAPANPDYLPITSIANMASQGVPDAVIIAEIERTHSVYKLSSEVITYLKQSGVSDRVIDYMLQTWKEQ